MLRSRVEALGKEAHREPSAPPRPPGFSPEHRFLASLNRVACGRRARLHHRGHLVCHATLLEGPTEPRERCSAIEPLARFTGSSRDRSCQSTDGRRSGSHTWQPFLPLPAPKLCFLFLFILQCSQTLDFKGKCGIFQCQKFKPEF